MAKKAATKKKEPLTDDQSVKLIVKELLKNPDELLTPVAIKQKVLKDAEMFDINRFVNQLIATNSVESVPFISKGSFSIKAKAVKSLEELVK